MKKVFATLLTLCLLLCLAACGEPAATTAAPTTEADTSVELVTAYECDNSTSMGAFSMGFAYESDYRSGSMTMLKEDEEAPGTFTCDENYNINHMEIQLDLVDDQYTLLVIDCTFDDAHRLLSAKVLIRSGEKEELRYSAEYAYDSQGHRTKSKIEVPGMYTSEAIVEYREDGQVLRQITTVQSGSAVAANTSVVAYEYDENGHMKSIKMYDENDQLLQELPATYEVKEDGTYYTLAEGNNKIVMVVNDKGQAVRQETYTAGELMVRIASTYDDAGRLIRSEQWSAYNDTTIVNSYAYSADGRLQEQKTEENGEEKVAVRTTFQTVEIAK